MSEHVLLRSRRLTRGRAYDEALFLGLVGAHICTVFRVDQRRSRIGWIIELVALDL